MKLQGDLRTLMDYGKVIITVTNLLLGNKQPKIYFKKDKSCLKSVICSHTFTGKIFLKPMSLQVNY